MKYKIYDGQLKRYALDNSTFNTKTQAINQLISFFSNDVDKEDLEKIKLELQQNGEYAEMYIERVQ